MLLLAAFVIPWATYAQTTVYTCDFESGSDGWTFVNGATGWHIGSAVAHGGSKSMYTSTDNGVTAGYGNAQVVYAYREMTIPAGASVSLTFDWLCQGEKSSSGTVYDYMRVCLAPAGATLTAGALVSGLTATSVPSGWYALDGGSALVDQTAWSASSVSNVTLTAGGTYRLLFVFRSDNSGNYGAPAVDNIVFTLHIPTCLPPSGLTIAPTGRTALFSWDASATAVESYQWLYTVAGTIPSESDWAAAAATTGTSVTISGLQSISSYTAWVRSRCSADDHSDTVSISFTTDCGYLPIPYTNDFESETTGGLNNVGVPPARCWSRYNDGTSGKGYPYTTTGASNAHSGSKYLYFYFSTTAGYPDNEIAILPPVDPGVNPLSSLLLSFYARQSSATVAMAVEVGTMSDTSDLNTFTLLQRVNLTNSYDIEPFEVSLSDAPAGDVHLALRVRRPESGSSSVYIDDLTLETYPTCFRPRYLELVDLTDVSARIAWQPGGETDSQWQISYKARGDADWTVLPTPFGSNPYTLRDLNPNTTYSVRVRTCCDVGDHSAWSTALTFTTECTAVTVTDDNPYTYGFETAGEFGCWRALNSAARYQNSSSTRYSYEGDWCLRFYSTQPDIVLLPVFSEVSTLQLDFYTRPGGTSVSYGSLDVGYLANAADTSTFVAMKTLTSTELSSTVYTAVHVNLATVPDGVRLALRRNSRNTTSLAWYVDNIVVSPLPSCVAPEAIVVTDVSATAASVGWTVGLAADDTWEVSYSADGETWLTTGPVNDNPATVTALTPNTEYQVRVRTRCNGGADMSDWSAAATFRTKCEAITVTLADPYVEGFENGFPDCWDVLNGNVTVKTSGNGLHTGSGYLDFRGAKPNAVALPAFADGSHMGLQLIFWTRPENFTNNSCGTFRVGYMTDLADTSTFVELDSWAYNTFTAYDKKIVPLTAVPDGARVVMAQTDNATNFYWYVDDVEVISIPSCETPVGLTVDDMAAESVSLSWTDCNETAPASWTVAYGPAAAFDLADAATYFTYTATSSAAEVPNLDSYTAYKFAVRANCSPSDASAWSLPVFDATLPDCGAMTSRRFSVGGGTSNSSTYPFYTPNNTTYTYGGSWMLFSADDLASFELYEGYLHGVALSYDCAVDLTIPVNIYITNSAKTVYSASDTAARSAMTLVYSGNVTFRAGEPWTELPFTEPFAYTGGGLELCVVRTALFNPVSPARSFRYTNAPSTRTVYRYGATEAMSGGGSTSSSRPNVRFSMCVDEPRCLAPLNLAAGVPTTSSNVLTWTNRSGATSWQLRYGDVTLDLGADDVTLGTVDPDSVRYTLSGLATGTAYSVDLRSICGEGDTSAWTSAIGVVTLCNPVTVFPVTYGFETSEGFPAGVSAAAAAPTVNNLGNCWRNERTLGTATTSGRLWTTNSATSYVRSGGKQSLMLPDKGVSGSLHKTVLTFPPMQFTSTDNGYVISFWIYRGTAAAATVTNYEGFRVYLSNTAAIDADALDLGFFSRYYNVPCPDIQSTGGWYRYKLPVRPSDMTGTVYLIFEGHSYFSSSTYVDDVAIEEAPSCMPLTAFDTVGAPASDRVTLTWREYDSDRPLQYLVEYAAAGAGRPDTLRVPCSAVTDDAATNTIGYTLQGLSVSTAYTVRVAAVCSVGDTSEWTSALSFRTACGAFSLPYSTGFETADHNSATLLPFCWQRLNSADEDYPSTRRGNARGGAYSLQFNTSAVSATTQLAVLPQTDIVASPMSGNRLVLYVKAENPLDSALSVGTMTDPSDAATFVADTHLTLTAAYTKFKINLSGAGAYAALRGNRNSSASSVGVYVDDVTLERQPLCDQPEGFARAGAVTSSAALPLAWIDGEASEWQLERTYAVGDTTVRDTVSVIGAVRGTVDADSVYYTLSGLESYTTYSLRLRAVCGEGQYSAWADATVSARTLNAA
ncbi:MAG: putative hemagluttinin family protein, partial [bacterium P3]